MIDVVRAYEVTSSTKKSIKYYGRVFRPLDEGCAKRNERSGFAEERSDERRAGQCPSITARTVRAYEVTSSTKNQLNNLEEYFVRRTKVAQSATSEVVSPRSVATNAAQDNVRA